MRLGNIKIGYRLGLGFGLVVIITGMIGIVANENIKNMWRITENMYRHPLTVSKAVRDIRTNIISMHRSMKDVALALDDAQINQAKSKVDNYERRVYKSFEIVFDRFLGEMSDVQTASDAFVNWKPIRDEVIQLRLAGKKAEAAAITKGKGADHVAFMNKKIQIMIDFANKKGDLFYEEAEGVKNATIYNSMILLGIVVMISSMVAVFITISITKPLLSMSAVSGRLKEGELSARNTNITAEETGVLAQSINELADSIEYQMFIRDGLRDISETFIESKNLKELSSNLVQKFTKLTGSQLVALYLLNKEQRVFEPFKSIGYQTDKLTSFSASNFEGEFGLALSGKGITHITDIPADTTCLFKTVGGSAVPREIINIPVLVKTEITAMISMASLHGYSKGILELLQLSWQILNTGFTSTMAEEEVRRIADELQTKNQELETLATELKNRSEELQEQNIELEEQRKQVESANQLKSEFLSNMSHELRTPLNSILSLSNVLKRQTTGRISEEETGYLEVVERNGKHLLELINDILDLSRIESSQMDVKPSTLSLSELVIGIAERIKPIAVDKGIDFKVNLAKGLPGVTTDEFLVHRILQNLIGNAVKFTEQGEVLITAQCNKDQISVAVKDTGIGIPAENLEHIFDEFRQVDGTIARRFEGSGLGLAIAKRSAMLLGGDILVESEKNKGTTFTLVMPVSLTETWQNGKRVSQLMPTADENRTSPVDSEKKATKLKSNNKDNPTILIVEDNPDNMTSIKATVPSEYAILEATDGQMALAMIQGYKPDLVLLDIMLPKLDGMAIVRKVKADKNLSAIPLMAITAKAMRGDRERILAAGFDDYVAKPFEIDILLKKVNNFLMK